MLSNKTYFKLFICTVIFLIVTTAQAKEKAANIPFIEFKQTKVQDAVGLLADIADINIAATLEASYHVSHEKY
jgi:hypothetical protein